MAALRELRKVWMREGKCLTCGDPDHQKHECPLESRPNNSSNNRSVDRRMRSRSRSRSRDNMGAKSRRETHSSSSRNDNMGAKSRMETHRSSSNNRGAQAQAMTDQCKVTIKVTAPEDEDEPMQEVQEKPEEEEANTSETEAGKEEGQ